LSGRAKTGATQNEQDFRWTPEYWQNWRESRNPYRQFKSSRDRQLAVQLLQLRAGESVLEVGCGYGWVTQALLGAADIRWVGVDASAQMALQLLAQTPAAAHNVFVGDAHRLPFRDAAFDKVLCSGVLMHLRDEFAVLAEIARVLRPGGRLVVSMNNALSPFCLPVMLHNARKTAFVQSFHFPGTYLRRLRALGLEVRTVQGDSIFATVSLSAGRFCFPPRFVFPALRSLDEMAVRRLPWLAYEVWFAAVKAELACAY
jgi:SAM-dependent methyltransferase